MAKIKNSPEDFRRLRVKRQGKTLHEAPKESFFLLF